MKNRCPSEQASRVVWIDISDYLLLNQLSQKLGVTITQALHLLLEKPLMELPIKFLSEWDVMILIVLLEREIKHCRERDKEDRLTQIKDKLLSLSLGPKPFRGFRIDI